jgi:hypothetical protein
MSALLGLNPRLTKRATTSGERGARAETLANLAGIQVETEMTTVVTAMGNPAVAEAAEPLVVETATAIARMEMAAQMETETVAMGIAATMVAETETEIMVMGMEAQVEMGTVVMEAAARATTNDGELQRHLEVAS